MPTFSQGDVVKVPFPYTNRPTQQSRPALVISDGLVTGSDDAGLGLIWVLMITSAKNRGWPGDIELQDLAGTGLPVPSVIRSAKVATIEARDAAWLGRISEPVRRQVLTHVRRHLGMPAPAH